MVLAGIYNTAAPESCCRLEPLVSQVGITNIIEVVILCMRLVSRSNHPALFLSVISGIVFFDAFSPGLAGLCLLGGCEIQQVAFLPFQACELFEGRTQGRALIELLLKLFHDFEVGGLFEFGLGVWPVRSRWLHKYRT